MTKQIEMTLNEIDQLPPDEWTSFDIVGGEVTMNYNQFHELAADYRAKVERLEELERFVRSLRTFTAEPNVNGDVLMGDLYAEFEVFYQHTDQVLGSGKDCLDALDNMNAGK